MNLLETLMCTCIIATTWVLGIMWYSEFIDITQTQVDSANDRIKCQSLYIKNELTNFSNKDMPEYLADVKEYNDRECDKVLWIK